jgi:acyl-CoA thioester hydrolase
MEQPEGFRHFVDVRVRFAETDAQGVVYHSNFLIYCEVGRAEYFRGLKLTHADPNQHFWRRKDREWDTVIAHAECDYRAPARFDDVLRVWTRIGHVGKSSYAFEYKIVRVEPRSGRTVDGVVVCDAKTVQVAVHKETRAPYPLPEAFVAALRAYEAA